MEATPVVVQETPTGETLHLSKEAAWKAGYITWSDFHYSPTIHQGQWVPFLETIDRWVRLHKKVNGYDYRQFIARLIQRTEHPHGKLFERIPPPEANRGVEWCEEYGRVKFSEATECLICGRKIRHQFGFGGGALCTTHVGDYRRFSARGKDKGEYLSVEDYFEYKIKLLARKITRKGA